jgi:competence protein ComEA
MFDRPLDLPPQRPDPPPTLSLTAPAVSLADRIREARAAPSGPALIWLAVIGVVGLVLSGYLLLHRPSAPASPPAAAAPVAPPAVPSAGPQIVVDVGGRVRHPGLVTLAAGARVADALRAAGGALRSADLSTVDLAARVSDGQLLLIGVPGAAASPGAAAATGPLGLNEASVDQLDALPGVGPVLAQHIVDFRQTHGGFTSVDQLRQVPGIGPRKFDELKSLVML